MRCFVREVMAMAKRFNKFQIHSLKLAFEESEHLTKDKKMDLVKVTGLDMEQITSWFNRKRARKRAKESVLKLQRIKSELKQLLQQRHKWEAELQMELEESKRKEAELGDENVPVFSPSTRKLWRWRDDHEPVVNENTRRIQVMSNISIITMASAELCVVLFFLSCLSENRKYDNCLVVVV